MNKYQQLCKKRASLKKVDKPSVRRRQRKRTQEMRDSMRYCEHGVQLRRCFTCKVKSEKEKHGENTQFIQSDTLDLSIK